MRRTYRSKKDTAGGLDHRDVLHTLDEKSSAFDAFYIQNIKQTKRELSCMGSSNHHGVASNKVRKRKYVKRIVKDVEPSHRESMSTSAYLTPDKSLHVNKAPDLFDQLLNSSPVWMDEPKREKKDDIFDRLPRRETKTYNKRKPLKKKINYSSDSIESDKENSEDITRNESDIKAHELLIEKESELSPKFDQSINNILKNLSLLNNLNRRSSNESIVKSFKNNMNRLTRNVSLMRNENSPLSSTPFTEKQRSKSIYKFSPIPMRDLGDSPKYVTISEENNEANDSVVFIHKNRSKLSTSPNDGQSPPVAHSTDEHSTKHKYNSKSLFSSQDSAQMCLMDNVEIKEHNEIEDRAIGKKVHTKTSRTQISLLQISEVEPLIGFSENTINKLAEENEVFIEDKDDSIILPVSNSTKHSKSSERSIEDKDDSIILPVSNSTKHSKSSEHSKIEKDVNNSNSVITTAIEHTMHCELFLGFTNIETENINPESEQDSLETNSDVNESVSSNFQKDRQSLYDTCDSNHSFDEKDVKEPIVAIERMDNSLFQNYYERMAEYNSHAENDDSIGYTSEDYASGCDETNDSVVNGDITINESDTGSSNDNNLKPSENVNFKSSNRESNETDESVADNNITINDPDTSSAKTNNLMLTRDVDLENNDDKSDTSNISSDDEVGESESSTTSNEADEKVDIQEEVDNNELEIVEELDNSEEFEHSRVDSEEDRCISFVTTRRRKGITNNASIFVLDDTQNSCSSNDCDKTVLSNKIRNDNDISLEKEEEAKQNVKLNDEIDNNIVDLDKTEIKPQASKPDARISTIRKTMRKSSVRDSFKYKSPENSIVELPDATLPIVLQPGKKWERSLSIYRRMTTINDHFDRSVLDDEDLHLKGRKYRQSVISTMKMQETQGLLHNESINSRRSTFVSKPSRSSIRVVKESNISRTSLSNTTIFDDLKGFLEDCDDTIVELSKLSIADDHEVTVLDNFHDTSRVATARDFVLRRCNQTDAILFDECYPDTVLKNCRKIGEGVYGEVFLWRATDGRARVMKIVPIAGSIKVNGEHQKDFHEIISEIVIAMELSALRTPIAEIECHFDEGKDFETLDLHSVENATDVFNEVKAVRCVYGNYPSRLLDLWELYDECKGSENDNPAILPVDQQYIVLELANAGQDLESYQFNSAEQAHALFLQVAFGLAVGEEAYQFEHRDLHWGNVLIAPTDQKFATFVLRGRVHRVPRRGVAATIIDYSLSRLSLPCAAPDALPPLYNDLATDDSLFAAVGDYQFQVYRLMRDKLRNEWKNFEPYTNILWLHYTVDKMITALRYKRTNTKTHKQYIAKLKGIKERILNYGGATQFVLTDNEH